MAESPAFLDPSVKPQNSWVFLDVIPYIRGVPVMETWVDIEDTVGKEIERAIYGEATVEEAIEAANERTAEFFLPSFSVVGGQYSVEPGVKTKLACQSV